MSVLLQRAREASVTVDGETLSAIGAGLVVFVCAEKSDGEDEAGFFARKVANMRLFADADGKTNLSVLDVGGKALVISQFTLAAEWRRGNRPGFSAAADPETGERLYEYFCKKLTEEGVPVETGKFGAHMDVRLVNDGPMTIWMDSQNR